MKLLPFIIISLLLNISCNKADNTPPQNYLEGLNATSVHENFTKYGPEKALDGKKSTEWLTMAGAAPDEGIFLFFNKRTAISKMKIDPSSEGNKIKKVSIYINGSYSGTHMVSKPIKVNRPVFSVFIRIVDVDGLTLSSGTKKYNSNKPAGISEITFYDNKGKKISVGSPLVKKGKITASSSLTPVESYNTDFLFDSRKAFGWADGNTEKDGREEFINFSFQEETTIEKIKIWNGYLRSTSHYHANERVKKIEISSGSQKEILEVKDLLQPQILNLKKRISGKSFTIKVLDIYKGKKYRDLVISELRFYDGKNWFIIESGNSHRRKKQLLKSISSTILNKVIDKLLHSKSKQNEQSLILRSNGSFVIYKNSSSGDGNENIVADGNWQIISNSKDSSKIKIFGRIHKIEETRVTNYNPYSGKSKLESAINESEKIFKDSITIKDSVISSSKQLFLDIKI